MQVRLGEIILHKGKLESCLEFVRYYEGRESLSIGPDRHTTFLSARWNETEQEYQLHNQVR